MDQESPLTQSDQASTISQVAPPPPPPTKNNMVLWLLLVILLLGSGFGLYLTARDQGWLPSSLKPTPTPTVTVKPTPTPDPTAGWRIYSSAALGIEFKYPVEDDGRNPLEIYTTETNPNVVALLRPKSSNLYSELYFDVTLFQSTQMNDWYKKAYGSAPQSQETLPTLQNGPIIGGTQSKQSVFNNMTARSALHIFVQKGNDLYQVVVPSTNNATQIQILSTFKFSDEMTTKKSCQYNGVEYKDGENFDATDGCNKCFCSDGNVGCTLIACQE